MGVSRTYSKMMRRYLAKHEIVLIHMTENALPAIIIIIIIIIIIMAEMAVV